MSLRRDLELTADVLPESLENLLSGALAIATKVSEFYPV